MYVYYDMYIGALQMPMMMMMMTVLADGRRYLI